MKNLYILAAMLGTLNAFAQGTWVAVPTGVTSDLNAIAFATPNLGMAVGADGAVLRTLDGGASWQSMPMLQDIDLNDVAFLSPGVIVAVGEKHWGKAAVVVSYDSGANWLVPVSPINEAMSSVAFVSPSRGFATAHGTVLRTDDGGLTWTATKIAGDNFLTRVRFTDPMHGVVTGGMHDQTGFTMRTNDGGATWTSDADLYIEPLKAIQHLDANTAWRIGGDFEYGAFLSKTNDGGASWSQTVIPDVKLSLNDIYFRDAEHGIAVGGTYLLQTADGGAHWSQSTPVDNGYLNAFGVSPDGSVFIVGSNGRIFKQSATSVAAGTSVASFTLAPNYPNPAATSTEFRFSTSSTMHTTLAVYGIDGSRVATIVDGVVGAGDHRATWNLSDVSGAPLPNGTYMVKLTSGEGVATGRVSIVR